MGVKEVGHMIRKLLASITVLILAVISACPVAAKGETAIVIE